MSIRLLRVPLTCFAWVSGMFLIAGDHPVWSESAEPPTVFSVSETAAAGTVVRDLAEWSGGVGLRWELHGDYADLPFVVDSDRNLLTVGEAATLDYERRQEYRLTLRGKAAPDVDAARDLFAEDLRRSGAVMEAVTLTDPVVRIVRLTITVLDAPEPPQFRPLSASPMRIDLGNPLDERFVTAADPDLDDELTYDILSGNEQGLLDYDPSSGCLRPSALASDDQSQGLRHRQLELRLRVTDSQGLTALMPVQVWIQGVLSHDSAWMTSDSVAIVAVPDDQPIAAAVADEPATTDNVTIADAASTAASVSSPITADCNNDQPALCPLFAETGEPAEIAVTTAEMATASDAAAGFQSPFVSNSPTRPPIELNAARVELGEKTNRENRRVASAPIHVKPAGLARSTSLRSPSSNDGSVHFLMQRVLSWCLMGATLMAIAAAIVIALRRRARLMTAAAPTEKSDTFRVEVEPSLPPAPIPTGRVAGRGSSNNRSLRQEMSNLLAVSQHFSLAQQAQADRRFYGRQLRLTTVAAIAASGIALGQAYLGLDDGFDHRNWIALACLTLIVAAAVKSFMSMQSATKRAQKPGPLSDEFRLD